MATKYYAVLTNVGAAKLANATALGAQVEITQMAVGDGNGVLPTPNPAQTALVHELRRKPLNSLSIDPNNANQIIAEQVIPEDEGGWWIREIGLFDKDGDMIAVANCAETYKPQLQEGSGRVQVVRMILIVSSTAAVTLKIDPSVVLATRQYVDDQIIQVKSYVDQKMAAHVAAADPHKQYAPKESPALTGRPTAPTAEGKDSSTQIANTAFVQAAIAALVGSSPEALDTLNELAAALGNDPNFATTVTNSLAGKMDKSANGSDIENVSVFLQNLGLTNAIIGDTCKEAGFYLGSELAPYLMHEDTHTAIRLVTLDSVRRVTTTTYTINYYANGLIQILGMTPTVSSLTPQTMTFPVAFPNACVRFALHNQESGVPSYNMAMYSNLSRTGVKIWGVANILGNGGSPTLGALPNAEISYEAWGY